MQQLRWQDFTVAGDRTGPIDSPPPPNIAGCVAHLVEMGFPEEKATTACSQADGAVETAFEIALAMD